MSFAGRELTAGTLGVRNLRGVAPNDAIVRGVFDTLVVRNLSVTTMTGDSGGGDASVSSQLSLTTLHVASTSVLAGLDVSSLRAGLSAAIVPESIDVGAAAVRARLGDDSVLWLAGATFDDGEVPTGPISESVFVGSSVPLIGSVTGGVVIGYGTRLGDDANALHSVVVGAETRVWGSRVTAVGAGVLANADDAVALGYVATVASVRGVAIGSEAQVYGDGDVLVGAEGFAHGAGVGAVAVGARATASGGGGPIAVGADAIADGWDTLAVGRGAAGLGTASVVVGLASSVTDQAVVVGHHGYASARSVGLGANVFVADSATASVALGSRASLSDGAHNGVAIGADATIEFGSASVAVGAGAHVAGGGVGATADWCTALGSSASVLGATDGALALGFQATVQGGVNGPMAIGRGALAEGESALALGFGAVSVGAIHGIAIGAAASVSSGCFDGIAVGYAARAQGPQAIALGRDASAIGTGAMSIGYGADSWGSTAIDVGYMGSVSGNGAIGIGTEVGVYGTNCLGLGSSARVSYSLGPSGAEDSIGIGTGVLVDNDFAIAIGPRATTTDYGGTAIGGSVRVSGGLFSSAIGQNVFVDNCNSVSLLGYNASVEGSSRSIMFATGGGPIVSGATSEFADAFIFQGAPSGESFLTFAILNGGSVGLPEFTDDSAAATAGLIVGGLYVEAATGYVKVRRPVV